MQQAVTLILIKSKFRTPICSYSASPLHITSIKTLTSIAKEKSTPMLKFRIFIITVGILSVWMGLTMSLVVGANVMSDTQQIISPFGQEDEIIEPEAGFVPIFVPTIDPNIIELKDQVQSALQMITVQAPATLRPAITKTP